MDRKKKVPLTEEHGHEQKIGPDRGKKKKRKMKKKRQEKPSSFGMCVCVCVWMKER